MKVCILSSDSFEHNYSSYHLMRDLIDYLLNNRCEVNLIQQSFDNTDVLPTVLRNRSGFAVFNVLYKQPVKSNFIKRILAEIRYYIRATAFIRKNNDSDVFFLQSNNTPYVPVFLIKHFTHKPIVYNVQDIFPQNAMLSGMIAEKSMLYKALCRLQKWSLKKCSAIITISEDMKETLVEAGAQEEKVSVAYNWANEDRAPQTNYSIVADGKFHVVYAGNIGRMQNVKVILETAKRLKLDEHIVFDIYGDGALKNSCIEYAAKSQLENVNIKQPVASEQAYQLYYNADVNVIPLAKNIVRTAFPSKAAMCVNCGKSAVFCIGKSSLISKRLCKIPNCYVLDENNSEKIAGIIQMLACKTFEEKSTAQNNKNNLFNKESSLSHYMSTIRMAVDI